MNRENVNPNFKFGDSDAFQLTDLDTDESLMLIPCDTAGNFSWTGVTRAPLQREHRLRSTKSFTMDRWIIIPKGSVKPKRIVQAQCLGVKCFPVKNAILL